MLDEAQQVTHFMGQDYVVFTSAQQLYRVALHVIWNEPALFKNEYLCLGGMNDLMSFIGSIGTLMENTGLLELHTGPFG